MRLIEIRLLDGPNLYRLEPAVKVEVTVGRRRSWYGQRQPARHSLVRLGANVPAARAARPVAALAKWIRRLHRTALAETVRPTIHATSEPGTWVVAFPWHEADRAEAVARAALRLAEEDNSARAERLFKRYARRVADTQGGRPPEWVRDAERRIPIISVSGTNGKSTTTRMLAHIAALAGKRVGMTTTDGVIVGGRMIEEGDYTGPAGAHAVLERDDLDLGVMESARGGILLRGLGYESNDASVLTNISADHLDLQGIHTLPELAEVKSVICRVTKASGTVVLNADDPLVAGVASRVKANVAYFSLKPRSARVRAHLARGGKAFVHDEGWLLEVTAGRRRRIVAAADVPPTLGGVALYNVANALAAAAGARALGFSIDAVAAGLRGFQNSADMAPGRLNLYRNGSRLVVIDYAHNEAGLRALLDTIEGLIGRRGRRKATLTAIIGSAGDRPDDMMRAVGRLAAERADEVAIKEDLPFLRGRSRASALGELRAGITSGGMNAGEVPDYIDEVTALVGELATEGRLAADTSGAPRVAVLMCHAHREEVARALSEAGFRPVASVDEVDAFRSAVPAKASGGGRAPGSRSAPLPGRRATRTRRPAPKSAA